MPQLHPPLSGMPLAFVSLLLVLELCSRVPAVARVLPAARALLLPALVLSCVATFLSGYQASSSMGEISEAAEAALGIHHAIGRFVLINSLLLAIFAWLARIARQATAIFWALYYVALAMQVGLTIWAGSIGGVLVFSHRIGVDRKSTRLNSSHTDISRMTSSA